MNGRNICSSGMMDGRCTDEDIAGRFRDLYEELYRSVPDDNLQDVGRKADHLVKERCNAGHRTSSKCHSVHAAVIEKAMGKLVHNIKDETYINKSLHKRY